MGDIKVKYAGIATYTALLSVLNAKNDTYALGQLIWAIDDVNGTFKKGLKVGEWDFRSQPKESAPAFQDLDWVIKPEASGAGGFTPFPVTIDDASYDVIGNDTVITDYRLKGVTQPLINCTVNNINFRPADMVVDPDVGKVTLLGFNTLGAGDYIGIFIPSAIVTADAVASLNTRLAKLEIYTKPLAMGGAIYIWQRPRADIPEEFQEVTFLEGKTIFGYKEGDIDFGIIGATGGGKTITIAKTNLPAVGIDLNILTGHQFEGTSTNDAVQAIGDALPPPIGGQTPTTVKTGKMGDGTALKKLDPYAVVDFIELKPEYRII